MLQCSAKSVAEALNYRHRSGVSHAVKRIEAAPKQLRTAIDRLENELQ